MKKINSKSFLYRHRFGIAYGCLGTFLIALIFILPLLAPNGLSEAEMESATHSYALHFDSIFKGDIVNLPYRALQKLSIMLFGLTIYSVKLPSIIIGAFLALLLILLLNRWFKNNVAIFASVLAVLSASFLYLAGSGTPLIMLVFWPTLLLWLGSKIQGVTKPKPFYCFIFAFMLLFAIFTPHLIYLVAFIVIFALLHPHLRFTIKTLPTIPLVVTILIILGGLATIVMSAIINPEIIAELTLTRNFSFNAFFSNLQTAFLPFFAWNLTLESAFLSPFIGLASVALAIIGLMSTTKGFFASRNSIATCLIIFTILLAGLEPESAILILLPMAILIAHGLRYVLDKWYDLFPENPYARISAVFPIGLFLGVMIYGGITHFIYGYRYIPLVANEFNNDLALIKANISGNDTLFVHQNTIEYSFYKILEDESDITILGEITSENTAKLKQYATLENWSKSPNGTLKQIITSPKSDNSDRIYIYTVNPSAHELNSEETKE